MNPFALPGPDFLAFYVVLTVIAAIAYRLWQRSIGPHGIEAHLTDPYAIAYLRGGAGEAIRVAVLSLLDRGLLVRQGEMIGAAQRDPGPGTNELERRILMLTALSPVQGYQLVANGSVLIAADSYEAPLREREVLFDEAGQRRQSLTALTVGAAILAVAAIKLLVALATGHRNVEILFVLMIVTAVLFLMLATKPIRQTPRGRALVEDLRILLRRARAPRGARLADAREVLMTGAILGIAALPSSLGAKQLFPRATGSSSSCGSSIGSSCGSSCGSSSSGGGGCGGGGCGGCGS